MSVGSTAVIMEKSSILSHTQSVESPSSHFLYLFSHPVRQWCVCVESVTQCSFLWMEGGKRKRLKKPAMHMSSTIVLCEIQWLACSDSFITQWQESPELPFDKGESSDMALWAIIIYLCLACFVILWSAVSCFHFYPVWRCSALMYAKGLGSTEDYSSWRFIEMSFVVKLVVFYGWKMIRVGNYCAGCQ